MTTQAIRLSPSCLGQQIWLDAGFVCQFIEKASHCWTSIVIVDHSQGVSPLRLQTADQAAGPRST
eukprot:1731805-Amphidinium_carterae.1